MGATATLATAEFVVEPGDQVACPVTIRNTGAVVDQFTIDVVGASAPWAAAEPPTVNLLPGDSVTINVLFAPPRSSEVLAGPVPFGVRVASHEDPDGSVIEEGAVTVAPFTDVTAQVIPAKIEASRRGRYEVAVDNHGNHPVGLRLYAESQEDDLAFRLDRPEFTLDPGMATYVKLRVRPRRPFLRGQSIRHQFRVLTTVDERESFFAEAAFVQRQMLPRWLVPVLIALLALLALLTAAYFTVLRPTIMSAARAEVAAQTGQLAAVASSAQQQAKQAAQVATSAQQAASGGGKAPGGGGAAGGSGSAPLAAAAAVPVPAGSSTNATDFRIEADTNVTAGDTRTFTTFQQNPQQPANSTLLVTDIILQNPFGDSGLLRIQRGDATDVLIEVGLQNYRDLDYHFVQPLVFQAGKPLEVSVNCQAAGTTGPNDGKCHPAVSFSGQLISQNNGG